MKLDLPLVLFRRQINSHRPHVDSENWRRQRDAQRLSSLRQGHAQDLVRARPLLYIYPACTDVLLSLTAPSSSKKTLSSASSPFARPSPTRFDSPSRKPTRPSSRSESTGSSRFSDCRAAPRRESEPPSLEESVVGKSVVSRSRVHSSRSREFQPSSELP